MELQVHDLHKSFDGRSPHGISFSISSSRRLGLLDVTVPVSLRRFAF